MNNYYPVIYLIDDIITYIRSSINNSNGNSNIKVVRAVSFFVIFLVFLLLLFFLLFSCFFFVIFCSFRCSIIAHLCLVSLSKDIVPSFSYKKFFLYAGRVLCPDIYVSILSLLLSGRCMRSSVFL